MRKLIFFIGFCCFFGMNYAQETDDLWNQKSFATRDSIFIDSLSINPNGFRVLNSSEEIIPEKYYSIDFVRALLTSKDSLLQHTDSLRIHYRSYPEFLTKTYRQFDPNRIVSQLRDQSGLYELGKSQKEKDFKPFDGLYTTGSISRGITTGTNQNSVLDSKLDLQITGKISDKVGIRASIQDSDIPIQQAGYSQNLNEFDQIFIELYSENWTIRGGDVDLEQKDSFFGKFQKKVQGLSIAATLNEKGNRTEVYGAGALVKGVFTRNKFDGQEGNQGPYKLHGPNGELFALVVSGSETVFVNGIRLKRGEDADYIIDYNAGEILFNSTYPINSEMRITVEFQYSDRNYSRVVATAEAKHYRDNFEIGGFVYNENDLRNQPLQQDLSDAQKQVLADAGDDENQMFAPSAVPAEFSESQVLYRKEFIGNQEVFVYSTNPEDELFRVKFTRVGKNNGNYILTNHTTISRVYEYVSPVDGIPQGEYEPIIRLFAPTQLQMAVINGRYHPSDKTDIRFEVAGSSHDENLFSNKDKGDDEGYAAHLEIRQNLFTFANQSQLNVFGNMDYLHKNFESIEPMYNVEFDRDWNLENPEGNHTLINTGVEYLLPQIGISRYTFQKLDYSNFSGSRHVLNSNLNFKKLSTQINGSYLTNDSEHFSSEFLRMNTAAVYHYNPFWTGVRFDMEDHQQKDKILNQLSGLSQKYKSYEIFTGVGDSTAVYAEIGYKYRVTDSLQQSQMSRAAVSHDYYLKSQLIHTANAKLGVYVNYREVKRDQEEFEKEHSLNSRIRYNQFLFNRVLNWNTTYETSSGTLPQQEYTFVEVEPGKGEYMWIDYNGDGIQDIDEFEIATYPDEAKFVRVFLPNQVFLPTRQTKLSQIIGLNFQQLVNTKNSRHWLTHFYNQTSYLLDRKVHREGNNFNLNPFHSKGEELAMNLSFRNSLFFNRGKQHYSTSYSYISSKNKNLFSTGLQASQLESHQIDFNHKIAKTWVFQYNNDWNTSSNTSESFQNRDYRIRGMKLNPKLSYLHSQQIRFDIFYQYYNRQNKIGQREQLNQQKLGASFSFSKSEKYSINGEFNYIYNNYSGDAFSPVAYEMLQGLQPYKNFTWELLFQRKITNYLDLNLAYYGRKSENSVMIHTGSVQLKAYF